MTVIPTDEQAPRCEPQEPLMDKEFVMRRRVQFAETDMAGVLHFANYYRIMEETEHAFWRSVGCGVMTRDGDRWIGWPRVSTSFEYFAPARFEDELELRLAVTKVGERSVTYELRVSRDGKRLALGKMTAVCCAIEGESFSPIAIPKGLRSKLSD